MSKRALLLVSSSALALMFALPAHAQRDRIGSVPPFDAFPAGMVGTPAYAAVDDVDDVIPGELVVDVKDDLSEEEIQALGNEYHLALRDNSPGVKGDGNVELANVEPSRIKDLIARLSRKSRSRAPSSPRTTRSTPSSGT
jgi:hypothetical protein